MKLLEILNEKYPHIKVIILSGHSDFEYMRQALKCGASDYLLKPIVKEDLKAALLKATDAIAEDRKNLRERIFQNIIISESMPMLKTNLLNKLLLGINLNPTEIIRRLSYLNTDLDFQHYTLAIIRIVNFEQMKSAYMNDTSLAFFAFENVMNESMGDIKCSVGFRSALTDNEFIYIFGHNDIQGFKEKLKELFESVIRNVEKYNKLTINVSISDECSKLSDIPRVYRGASHLWGKIKKGEASGILFSEDFYDELQLSSLVTIPEIMGITGLIEQNEKQQLMSIINGIFQRVNGMETDLLEVYRKITAKLFFCIEKILDDLSVNLAASFDLRTYTYNDLISKYNNPEDLKYGLIKVMIDVADLVSKRRKMESNSVIAKAKEYIDSYFFEDISLEVLAGKFFLNSTYFCELFKKETGYSFNKYLNGVRMDKAKELLKNQDMKPKDVSELVGFKELGYFCSVFKKYTGMTPTEYKQG